MATNNPPVADKSASNPARVSNPVILVDGPKAGTFASVPRNRWDYKLTDQLLNTVLCFFESAVGRPILAGKGRKIAKDLNIPNSDSLAPHIVDQFLCHMRSNSSAFYLSNIIHSAIQRPWNGKLDDFDPKKAGVFVLDYILFEDPKRADGQPGHESLKFFIVRRIMMQVPNFLLYFIEGLRLSNSKKKDKSYQHAIETEIELDIWKHRLILGSWPIYPINRQRSPFNAIFA
ncbi:hypothetical protein B0T24DRAFT_586967 [Lasiosphaeria ovina]|uniref:Uncharacterized protein n=1 Tax=Lasiosphaeria ovina TaxID=92902 RepID=A0AAE0TWM4_9PEZI|nr:hypothetical protein B0T24DRAFT_586967 [Lasiosphaeria ovina]